MPWTRRVLGAALIVLASAASARASEGDALKLIIGFSENSATHAMASLLERSLARELDRPVVIQSVPGDNGFRGALATHAAAPDGSTLLIADTLTLSLNEVAGGRPFSINALTPLAKLTLGISVALIVREESEIEDWDDLLALAEETPPTVSVSGRGTAYGVAWSMIERETGIAFEHVLGVGNGHILDDVADGRADLGLVTTNTIDLFNAVNAQKLRPIVTFGAERSARYPETPTFAELTEDDKNDFTYSFALFGPPELPAETVEQVDAAFQRALADPRAIEQAATLGLVLEFNDPDVLRETIARDLRVAESVESFLDRP